LADFFCEFKTCAGVKLVIRILYIIIFVVLLFIGLDLYRLDLKVYRLTFV